MAHFSRYQTKPYPSAGGKVPFEFSSFVPPRAAIDALILTIRGVATTVPAGDWSGALQRALFDTVELDRRLRIPGIGLGALAQLMLGKDMFQAAVVTAGAGKAFEVSVPLYYRDPNAYEPADHAPASDWYRGTTLNVNVKKAADVLAGLVIDATQTEVVVEAQLSPLSDGKVPTSLLTNFVEVSTKEVTIPAGDIVHAFLVKNDGSAFTDAEMGNMRLTLDGALSLFERERLNQRIRAFNALNAAGAGSNEVIPYVSPTIVPIYSALPQYKGPQLARANSQALFAYDGSLAANAARLYYRMVEVQSPEQRVKGGKRIGYAGNAVQSKGGNGGFESAVAAEMKAA
jgi:hypothetical protein